MRKFLIVFFVLALAGCSTTPEQLESDKSTYTETRTYPDNYQALYRKVYGPASRCLAVVISGSTQLLVEAQLYPDLGVGEIAQSMQSMYGRLFYYKIKIEKAGQGSKMTVSAGSTFVNKAKAMLVFGWADGKTDCS